MFDEAWRYVDAFSVHQAVALWVNEEPAGSSFSTYPVAVRGRFKAVFQMLRGAILRGELKADHSTNTFVSSGRYGDSTVTREELIRYARQKDLVPAFLFDTISPEKADRIANDQRPPKNKGGRPPEYDWDKMWAEIVRVADMDRLPPTQAALVEHLSTWFSNGMTNSPSEHIELEGPSPSSIKEHIRPLYSNLKALGWSPE